MLMYAFHTRPSKVAWGISKLNDIFGKENVKVQKVDDTDKPQGIEFYYDGPLLAYNDTLNKVKDTFESVVNLSLKIHGIVKKEHATATAGNNKG